MHITLTLLNAGLHISPAPPYILKYLEYNHRSFETVSYQRVNKFETRLLYHTDGSGGIITLQGFFSKMTRLIPKYFDTYAVVDARDPMPEIDWERVKKIGMRDYQIEPTVEFLAQGAQMSGILTATGGFGKTHMQAFTYAAWNGLNTILAVPLKRVATQTYEKFQVLFPEKHIGLVGDGHHDISEDITIATYASLKTCALEKCELFMVDEIQKATGDGFQGIISAMTPKRIFGYTATDKNLFNNADKLLTGVFGPRLIHVDYQEAEQMGAVVPGVVYMLELPQQLFVSGNSFESKIRNGIKKCKERNQLIAQVCAAVPDNWQTLIFVETVQDHLANLYKVMPAGARYVHRCSDKKNCKEFALTPKQQEKNINEFVENDYQFLIATDALQAGVDIQNLRVVVQASGGSSETEILQEAFRGSRILTEAKRRELGVDEKTHFVLIDFQDNHDAVLKGMAEKREAMYKKQGWAVKKIKNISEINWKATE